MTVKESLSSTVQYKARLDWLLEKAALLACSNKRGFFMHQVLRESHGRVSRITNYCQRCYTHLLRRKPLTHDRMHPWPPWLFLLLPRLLFTLQLSPHSCNLKMPPKTCLRAQKEAKAASLSYESMKAVFPQFNLLSLYGAYGRHNCTTLG